MVESTWAFVFYIPKTSSDLPYFSNGLSPDVEVKSKKRTKRTKNSKGQRQTRYKSKQEQVDHRADTASTIGNGLKRERIYISIIKEVPQAPTKIELEKELDALLPVNAKMFQANLEVDDDEANHVK